MKPVIYDNMTDEELIHEAELLPRTEENRLLILLANRLAQYLNKPRKNQ